MNTRDNSPDSLDPHAEEPTGVGAQNIARLVGESYQPEAADPAFVRRVADTLYEVAAEMAAFRVPIQVPEQDRLRRLRWRLTFAMTAAATVAAIALLLHAHRPAPTRLPEMVANPTPAEDAGYDRLTPRPRAAAPAAQAAKLGEVLETQAGQRRRVGLPDGSVAYLNEKTRVQLDGERQLTVKAGEVFLEVAPRQPGADDALFVVQTPTRKVHALGTRFAVKAEEPGTEVVVTQGKVLCCPLASDVGQLVVSGQQLTPPDTVAPAARASHVLDWTRDLMTAAESPLVPASKYGGGALVAVDPNGQQTQLSLRKYHIDVHIEDGFARTTIDQTYFNHNTWRMEGTFYFPLPPDASLSRLAMYVADGKDALLMEGGMAERDYARTVFETIVSKQKDPALLEWIDGSTFKMRVFPLEGRQEKRIILSYTQRLPGLYGRTSYRFPAGHNLEGVREWAFHARVKGGAGLDLESASHKLQVTRKDGDLLLDASERDARINKDVELSLHDAAAAAGETIRFSAADHENSRYLMVRYRPPLTTHHSPLTTRRNWVFLFESDASRDPLVARAQVQILNNLMVNAEPDDTFVLLTAGAQVRAFDRIPRPLTPANVRDAIAFLDQTHLVGALDLDRALTAAQAHLQGPNPCLVHIGSGVAVLGERREDVLVRKLAENVPYVGVGVGKRWGRSFMKAAAERTGGHFTQINPDEPIAWRSFELLATLNTPRLLNLQVVDNGEQAVFLPYATSVAQGEELCAIARLPRGARLPRSLTIHGKLDGQSFFRVVPVAQVAAQADYLPRTWAKLEIDRLLAEDSQQNKAKIIELSKAMYVMTPFTSLLVLENEAMYEQYKVDRGRKDHWALYPCPAKVAVVHEPLQAPSPKVPDAEQKLKAEDVAETVAVRTPPPVLAVPRQAQAWGGSVMTGLQFNGRVAYPEDVSGMSVPGGVRLWDSTSGGMPNLDLYYWGWHSQIPTNHNIDRLEEISVPGPVNPGMGMTYGIDWVNYYKNHGYQINGGFNGLMGGGRINYAPVFVTPTMQWAVPGGMGGPGNGPLNFKMQVNSAGVGMPEVFVGGTPETNYERRLKRLLTQNPQVAGQVERVQNISMQSIARADKLRLEYGPSDNLGLTSYYLNRLVFDTTEIQPIVSAAQLNGLRYVPAGRSLIVRGSTRYYTKATDGVYPRLRAFTSDLDLPLPVIWSPDGRVAASGGDIGSGMININNITDPFGVWALATERSTLTADRFRLVDGKIGGLDSKAVVRSGLDSSYLIYHRPKFSADDRLFTDLLAYAPGMNTSAADLLAVVEAEAAPEKQDAPGTIEPNAKALIDRARQIGWQTLNHDDFAVTFDGTGRYRYERTTADGLRQTVVCDGQTLWHLYPDLGVGARRAVSRFHRAELARWLPEVLPPAEDLARGGDLKVVGERTVALVPRDADPKGHLRWHLYFDADGRLSEKRLVRTPEEKPLLRLLVRTGTVELWTGDNTQLGVRAGTLAAARAPELKPDTNGLVVLPLPYRSKQHVIQTRKLDPNLAKIPEDAESRLALLAVALANRDTQLATQVVQQLSDHGRHQSPLGLYTLLAACGGNVEAPHGPELRQQFPREPLARYLAIHSNPSTARHCDLWEIPAGDTLLQRLTAFRALLQRWKKGEVYAFADAAQREQERKQALDFISRNRSGLGWALLDQVETCIAADAAGQRAIAPAWLSFAELPGLGYAARYEHARGLLKAGQKEQARQQFQALYEQTLQNGVLPPLDAGFREALGEAWNQLVRTTAAKLAADNRRLAAVTLAWQCLALDDTAAGDAVLAIALDGIAADPQRLAATLDAVEYQWQRGKAAEAQALVQALLTDDAFGKEPALWRLAGMAALVRQQPDQMVRCLEVALDLEFRDLPETINLQPVRDDYGALLRHYADPAGKLGRADTPARRELAVRVVRAADRWRSLDTDTTAPSRQAARILTELGELDLAWQYLTTPLAQQGADAAGQVNLTEILPGWTQAGTFDLRASDAPMRWKQAAALARSGLPDEAAELLRK